MDDQDPNALLQKARKAAESAPRGFSLFGGRTEKWESAADLYTQAANAFRKRKQYEEAGEAYERAADIQQNQLKEPMDMANTLIEASKVYQSAYQSLDKRDPKAHKTALDAARVLQQAINHYTSTGNFRRAATHQDNLAKIYENQVEDRKKALEAYNTAAEWFESDNAEALANKLFLKVAELSALEGDYARGIDRFESVAKSSVQNNLMKWSVKEYLLKAGLCHLAVGDHIATTRAIQQYKELDNSFAAQRECKFLENLTQAAEDGEPDKFVDHCHMWDKLSTLEPWKTAILKVALDKIKEAEEEVDFS